MARVCAERIRRRMDQVAHRVAMVRWVGVLTRLRGPGARGRWKGGQGCGSLLPLQPWSSRSGWAFSRLGESQFPFGILGGGACCDTRATGKVTHVGSGKVQRASGSEYAIHSHGNSGYRGGLMAVIYIHFLCPLFSPFKTLKLSNINVKSYELKFIVLSVSCPCVSEAPRMAAIKVDHREQIGKRKTYGGMTVRYFSMFLLARLVASRVSHHNTLFNIPQSVSLTFVIPHTHPAFAYIWSTSTASSHWH